MIGGKIIEELQWRTESDGRETGGPQTKSVNGRQIPRDATNTSKFKFKFKFIYLFSKFYIDVLKRIYLRIW